jgi:hypothetical protein
VHVLYVTTRQWNPGDEFILRGSRSILREAGFNDDVSVIYNKSPQTTALFERFNFWKSAAPSSLVSSLDFALNVGHYDNSLKKSHDLSMFDAVVFAGSPGWFGGRLTPMYDRLVDYSGKVLFLGLGVPNKQLKLSDNERAVLGRSMVFCRNAELVDSLGDLGVSARYLPCPALLSSPFERDRPTELELVGLGFNSPTSHKYQRISPEKYGLQAQLFDYMLDNYECEIVCHYVDELEEAGRTYGSQRVRYAYDAADYPALYGRYDFVLSSRVHGCGMASSVGVPNAAIGHDARAGTVDGFNSMRAESLGQFAELMPEVAGKLPELHDELKQHKSMTLASYVEAVGPYLQC